MSRTIDPPDYPLETGEEPPLGAHIVTPRRGYTHHGIYVGSGCVVQYGGLSRGLRRGPVEEVSITEFSHGCPIMLRRGDFAQHAQLEVVRRARSRIGEDRYHLLTNNCEHFCEWCIRGQNRSYQVEALLGVYGRAWRRIIEPLGRVLRFHTANINARAADDADLRSA